MPLTQMQQKKLLRKNTSLDGYQSGFLYKAMKELNNPELNERIKKEFNSKKRKEEILMCAWENLNNISGKIAKEFFGIRNREDIDKMIKDMRNKKTTASAEKVFAYKGKIITASSKQEAIQKVVAKISDDELRKNYNKAFEYCEKIKINPCAEFDDSGLGGISFSFGVNNDWNTVSADKNGGYFYSLNDGEKYNKRKITFEQLKKILDKYAADNKANIGNNGVVTRTFM